MIQSILSADPILGIQLQHALNDLDALIRDLW